MWYKIIFPMSFQLCLTKNRSFYNIDIDLASLRCNFLWCPSTFAAVPPLYRPDVFQPQSDFFVSTKAVHFATSKKTVGKQKPATVTCAPDRSETSCRSRSGMATNSILFC